jgi:hypothetical protein
MHRNGSDSEETHNKEHFCVRIVDNALFYELTNKVSKMQGC